MQVKATSFKQTDSLCILQFTTEKPDSFELISASEAMLKNLIEVKEISDGGSVNNIFVINHSSFFILFIDGDILSGAKQNRVLNTSVLLAPQSKTVVPVSCVEAGRWRHTTKKFEQTDYTAPLSLRSSKSKNVSSSLNEMRGAYANQSEVWNEVSSLQQKMNTFSESSNLSDVFHRKKSSYENFLSTFEANALANGAAFFIDRKLVSIEIFNERNLFREYFPKLLRGISLDVFGNNAKETIMSQAEADYKTIQLMDDWATTKKTVHPGVGVGEEWRYQFNSFSGLHLNYGDHLIHSSCLADI